MASTLSLSSGSLSYPSIYAPPPSQDPSMQHILVPDVFVIPPEEEQHDNPPWCYFDAAEAAKDCFSTYPDIDTLTFALNFHQQTHNPAPVFHRSLGNDSQETVIMPKKGGLSQRHSSRLSRINEDGRRSIVLDEEIVEVIKVRRNEGMVEVGEAKGQGMKKSKTFRARASEAFKSIRKVGKGTRTPATETWAARQNIRESRSMDVQGRGTLPRPSTPNLSRRKSAVFSQFFTFSQNSTSPAVPSAVHAEPPTSSTSGAADHWNSVNNVNNTRPPSSTHARRLHPSPSLEDWVEPRSEPSGRVSPAPKLPKKKLFRSRLSVLDLQRLFNSGSSSYVAEETAPPSTPSHSGPELVVDILSSDSCPYSLESSDMSPSSSTPSSFASSLSLTWRASPSTCHIDTDTEMRLDSLHFDSLHFDPDEF